MTNEFATILKNMAEIDRNKTYTTNGAVALSSTTSALVDLFGVIGATRNRTEDEIGRMVLNAAKEDLETTLKIIFYARDVRGGLGERRAFRVAIETLAYHYPESVAKNLKWFGVFGRFDDWYCLVGTPCETAMWRAMSEQFETDLYMYRQEEPISLLAKWIKTPDASSQNTRMLGVVTARQLGYTVYEFKRLLRQLRKYLKVVEADMCANRWSAIDYESVPSRAGMLYKNAFRKHDEDRYERYIDAVQCGEKKINAATLFPYDIVEKFMYNKVENDRTLEAQWKALPNYVDGENNFLVMADTSGSMWGRPMATSVGLALYFAERNRGPWRDLFMTFESHPSFVKINRKDSLAKKVKEAMSADWGGSTNLEAALLRILFAAQENDVKQEDMPASLIIITDMEFDNCVAQSRSWETFYQTMERRFNNAGYKIPNIVFWNVNSVKDTYHADANHRGVQLASGQSPSVFKTLVGSMGLTPFEYMMSVINVERYAVIKA